MSSSICKDDIIIEITNSEKLKSRCQVFSYEDNYAIKNKFSKFGNGISKELLSLINVNTAVVYKNNLKF